MEEQEKHISVKLAQLQLGELTEKKKNKGKNQASDIQAPVVSVDGLHRYRRQPTAL